MKRIVILGAGESGAGAAVLAKKEGFDVFVSDMSKITPRTLSGFMELLPAPQQQMEQFLQVLRETYALYGFTPLDTPLIFSAITLSRIR